MWLARVWAVCALTGLAIAQEVEDTETVRRLRFRRPRPKLIDVENPDGDLVGSPVELRLSESELNAAVAGFPSQNQNSGSAALDALIATAQRDEPLEALEPLAPVAQEPRRRPAGGRTRGGVPRRRPRPQGQERPESERQEARRRPNGPREEPVATLERYSHKNEDGSFTFGYVGADGSFREETRGADCITRGKYGYIDPDGVKREYTYTSGLPCNVGEDGELQDLDGEDPVDPRERFRQTAQEQLTEDQIPQAARPRRPIQRQPATAAAAAAQPAVQPAVRPANAFSNFGANAPQRAAVPRRRPAPAPRPSAGQQGAGQQGALQNLLTIADERPAAPQPARAPRPPIRIAARPTSRPLAPANPGTFDFDAELEGFTLNRPSLTFDRPGAAAGAAAAPAAGFQSQLTFNQNTGTFSTNLQQNIRGGGQINLVNAQAPAGAVTQAPSPAPTNPVPLGTTTFPASVFASPRPTPPASPSPTSPSRAVVPAATVPLDFKPLNIPDIAQVKVTSPPPSPSPTPKVPAPPTLVPRPPTPPSEAPRAAAPVRIVPAPSPAAPAPASAPAPAPAAAAAAAPAAAPARPANTFFVFQPFSQGQSRPVPSPQPASVPFRTPINPSAFTINLAAPAGSVPAPQARPRPPPGQASFRPQPQAVRPFPGQLRPAPQQLRPAPQQLRPAPQQVRPTPQQARPTPQQVRPAAVPQAAPRPAPQPTRPVQATPQLQFGFQPVQQGRPQQGRPQSGRPQPFTAFTAFRNGGPPPQQRPGAPQQFAPRPAAPQGARPQQLGVPPQLQQQGAPRPVGAPQFAQFDSRFAPRPSGQAPGQVLFRPQQFTPGARPPQGAPSVFSPAQLRGA